MRDLGERIADLAALVFPKLEIRNNGPIQALLADTYMDALSDRELRDDVQREGPSTLAEAIKAVRNSERLWDRKRGSMARDPRKGDQYNEKEGSGSGAGPERSRRKMEIKRPCDANDLFVIRFLPTNNKHRSRGSNFLPIFPLIQPKDRTFLLSSFHCWRRKKQFKPDKPYHSIRKRRYVNQFLICLM